LAVLGEAKNSGKVKTCLREGKT